MRIEIIIDEQFDEPVFRLHTNVITAELQALIEKIQETTIKQVENIIALKDDKEFVLPLYDIAYFESSGNYVLAHAYNDLFKINTRLYEIENMVMPHRFMRISKSVIIHIDMIHSIERSFGSPYLITLKNGQGQVLASNQYIKLLKERIINR